MTDRRTRRSGGLDLAGQIHWEPTRWRARCVCCTGVQQLDVTVTAYSDVRNGSTFLRETASAWVAAAQDPALRSFHRSMDRGSDHRDRAGACQTRTEGEAHREQQERDDIKSSAAGIAQACIKGINKDVLRINTAIGDANSNTDLTSVVTTDFKERRGAAKAKLLRRCPVETFRPWRTFRR